MNIQLQEFKNKDELRHNSLELLANFIIIINFEVDSRKKG